MAYSRQPAMQYTFGPGPITPAVRGLIVANIVVFVATLVEPGPIVTWFGLSPALVIQHGEIWQVATYLFVHSPSTFTHILFNMLALWMFGVDLERRWGTPAFLKYYFVCGVGAALSVMAVSLLPYDFARSTYAAVTIGASGAIYGVLLAWALLFPDRRILFMFLFPVKATVYVLIIGAMAFFASLSANGGPVSNLAHLGGLVVGWLYLSGPRDLRLRLQYQLSRWRMERMRRRFSVHKGGRDDWGNRIH